MNTQETTPVWDGQKVNKLSVRVLDPKSALPQEWNDHLMTYLTDRALGLADQLRQDSVADVASAITAHEQQAVTHLLDDVALERARVDLLSAQISGAIIEKYSLAETGRSFSSMDEWVAARLGAFDGISIASDVDKTLTQGDGYLNQLPGSVAAENYMAHPDHGRDTFPLALHRYWSHPLQHSEANDVYVRVGQAISLRPGVPEMLLKAKEQQIPVTIISAQFKPVIDGVMTNLPEGTIQEAYSVKHNDIRATDKGTVVRKLAVTEPDRALIYIGDGASDLPAMTQEARSLVAVYFALEGGDFARELEAQQLPFYTYRDFNDISATLERLGVFQ